VQEDDANYIQKGPGAWLTKAHETNNASAHRQLLPAGCLCAHRSYEYLASARYWVTGV